jgi:hypothetical protein
LLIGRRNQHDLLLDETLEQPAHQHGVADVRDVELIEAQ